MNLEKIKKFANSWGLVILMAFVLFRSCGTSSKAKVAAEKSENTAMIVDSLQQRIKVLEEKTVGEKEVRNVMEEVMLDYLIYEDELDNKQITISQIKDKIKQND
jgi:hypothetical protein